MNKKEDRISPFDFICPYCGLSLNGQCFRSTNDKTSGFYCPDCDVSFPMIKGVVRYVGEKNYADTFGFQWDRRQRNKSVKTKCH